MTVTVLDVHEVFRAAQYTGSNGADVAAAVGSTVSFDNGSTLVTAGVEVVSGRWLVWTEHPITSAITVFEVCENAPMWDQYTVVLTEARVQALATPIAAAAAAAVVPAYAQASQTRALNTPFTPHATRPTLGVYSVDIAATLSLSGGQSGTVFLETSPTGSAWTTQAEFTNGNAGALTVGLNITQTNTAVLTCTIPPGYQARLRTANNTGAPTFTYRRGQESQLT